MLFKLVYYTREPESAEISAELVDVPLVSTISVPPDRVSPAPRVTRLTDPDPSQIGRAHV